MVIKWYEKHARFEYKENFCWKCNRAGRSTAFVLELCEHSSQRNGGVRRNSSRIMYPNVPITSYEIFVFPRPWYILLWIALWWKIFSYSFSFRYTICAGVSIAWQINSRIFSYVTNFLSPSEVTFPYFFRFSSAKITAFFFLFLNYVRGLTASTCKGYDNQLFLKVAGASRTWNVS